MKKLGKMIFLLLILIILGGAGTYIYLFDIFTPKSQISQASFTINGQNVNDFCYLLQYNKYNSADDAITQMSDTEYDLFVIDMYFDENPWSTEQISNLKETLSENQERIVLCYISIGEAESYRPYWNASWDADEDGIPDDGAPSWLDQENPDWEGNYKVRYWDPTWQKLIFGTNTSYLDQIINIGFNGAYLDIIDAFEYYEEQGIEDAAERMVDFVTNLSSYCKAINSEFLIVPQNGEYLGNFANYLDAVDGIGREDVFFTGNRRNSANTLNETTSNLALFLEKGCFVLNIEYPTFPVYIRNSYELGSQYGYITYVGPRELDEIAYYQK
ncbi:MJ1477/TM1410 family putative glycoside hydrolase [Candidatus Harpocratesius sp.]